jgi:UDP-2,3-diacylglucosamine pyrophosphatase LpxH
MLVFISDLHLADETSGTYLDPATLHVFGERLRYLAARASWRADGTYHPIDRLDLVLLGDVLDLIRSERWLQACVRPWDELNSPELVQTVSEIVDQVLAANEASLGVLRGLATQAGVWVAPAARNGQPVYNAPPQPVSVRTYYLVGNHDWLLHVPGRGYDILRQKVSHHLGLANPLDQPFPHDPAELDVLLETLRRHRVLARHGDIYDPLHFTEDRNASSLGDAIAIQLVQRFAVEVRTEVPDAPAALLAGLTEMHDIRPVLLVPLFLEGLLERACPQIAMRKQIKQIWDGLADELLQLKMVRERDTWSPVDLVDGLERALKFSRRVSVGWASKIVAWLNNLRGARTSSYFEHALMEPDFRNRRARHIVYGHTHQAETVPLDASYADGYVLNQVYFNTGTWRRTYQATQMAPADHEFIAVEHLGLTAFFEGDERGGRPFEVWSGMQGLPAEEARAAARTPAAVASARAPVAARGAVIMPHFGVTPGIRPTAGNL